jgi:hypothetical protein
MKLQDLYETPQKVFTTKEEVENWLRLKGADNYKIHDDLSVDLIDLNRKFNLRTQSYAKLPVKFNKVDCFFMTPSGLVTLEGMPRIMNNDLVILASYISSLEGCTETVNGYMRIKDANQIKNLKGGPKFVEGEYWPLNATKMTSFAGIAEEILGGFRFVINDPIPMLDLLRVKGLNSLTLTATYNLGRLIKIMDHFIKQPYGNKRIIECQSALIDAGYEAFACFAEDIEE